MTESIITTTTTDDTTTIYVERDMGITTDKPALLGEIVRCRDCVKLKRGRATGVFGKCTNRVMGEHYVRPDDYCAWGERKEIDHGYGR